MVQAVSNSVKRDPRGAKPGERRGGRAMGTTNKAVTKRLAGTSAVLAEVDLPAKRGKRADSEPKKLLLTAMNAAWVAAQDYADEVLALRNLLEKTEAAAKQAGLPIDARNELLAKATIVRQEMNAKATQCHMATQAATDLAVKAAPYCHAKLANIESKVSGDLKIVLQKF